MWYDDTICNLFHLNFDVHLCRVCFCSCYRMRVVLFMIDIHDCSSGRVCFTQWGYLAEKDYMNYRQIHIDWIYPSLSFLSIPPSCASMTPLSRNKKSLNSNGPVTLRSSGGKSEAAADEQSD